MRALVLLLLVLALIFSAFAGDTLPDDEQKLYEYAHRHMNRKEWRIAERAFKKLMERFPDGKLVERALYDMGNLHLYHSRRRQTARDWFQKLIARYPKSEHYWPARLRIAQSYATADKDQAIALYRALLKECPEANRRSEAVQRILDIQDKYLWMSVNRTFVEDEKAKFRVATRNIDKIEFVLYRVAFDELIERLDAREPSLPAAVRKVPRKRWTEVRRWTEVFGNKKSYENREIAVTPGGIGFYVVEGRHDGLTFKVSFPVNRYGLIVKSAAGKLVVFAQDRRNGRPVPKMPLQVRVGENIRDGRTDASGMYVSHGVAESAFVVGVHEGDYVFANVSTYGWTGRESRYYVTTDRPIYRPGQKVEFKIVHRVQEGARLDVIEGLKVRIKIHDAKSNVVHDEEYVLGRFGSCHGSFRLGEEPSLGTYRIEPQPLGDAPPVHDWNARFGRFRVDEYRKPEYKVGVEFDRPHYVQGDTLRATIRADYYFGSPVRDATVRYRVRRAGHWHRFHKRASWFNWYGEDYDFGYGGRRYGGEIVHKGEGKTDAQGRLQVSLEIPRWDRDAQYSVEADVRDLSRRNIRGSASVVAARAEVGLDISMDRYFYRPKDRVVAHVTARTLDGKPSAGRLVRVTAYRHRWNGEAHEDTELKTISGVTSPDGTADYSLMLDEPGSYFIKATTKDDRGNETSAKRWIWIASHDWDGGQVNWQGLDIVPDKAAYKQGETAVLLVSSEIKDMYVLVTLESTRIHHQVVVKLSGNTKTVRVKLDDPSMVPNLFVSAVSLHGNRLFRRQRGIAIDPTHKFLQVEIEPDKKTYRPREPAVFRVRTLDRDGKPVRAEVALGIADEAVYALQKEFAQDIRRFFVSKRWNRVAMRTSLQYWSWGQGDADEEQAEEGVGVDTGVATTELSSARMKKGKAAAAPTEVRSEFADTMLWTPSVLTDENGVATVRLERTADNLTTWRVTARAVTADGLVGQSKEAIIVRKNVIVRLQTPRFFTQGDKGFVTAIAHNYLPTEKEFTVVIEAEGLALEGAAERTLTIAANGEARIDWPATPTATGTATITVKALTDEESDAMKRSLPLLPHGSVQWTARAGLVKGAVTETLTLPDDAIHDATELLITVSPTHASTVLDALDYLADYPYGCVEQTMSRFLPSAITQQVLRKLDIRRPELEQELPGMIGAGLRRLYDFQRSDGGWGWWRNDQASPFITAYVVYGLSVARDADVEVKDHVLRRGVAALQTMLDKSDDEEERVHLLFALAAAGKQDPSARGALADALPSLAPVHKAMLALVLHRGGEPDEARRVLRSLAADVDASEATARWPGLKQYRWMGSPVEATAFALKAFVALDPHHALVPKIVTWLAMNRDGNHWVSTRQTAMVVFAMADYIAFTGEKEPDLTLTLDVNGKTLYERRVTKENWHEFDGTVRLDAGALLPGKNVVSITKQGRGTPVYSLYLKHFRKADRFTPSQGGLRLSRSYARVLKDGKTQVLEDGATLRSGEEVEVTLKIRADREYRYLMVEDPYPAGFEAVREQRGRWARWSYWYAHKEFRDEKMAVAVTTLPQGEREIKYRLRAETPGAFRVLPALVWNMYRPGEGGNSGGMRVVVVDR